MTRPDEIVNDQPVEAIAWDWVQKAILTPSRLDSFYRASDKHAFLTNALDEIRSISISTLNAQHTSAATATTAPTAQFHSPESNRNESVHNNSHSSKSKIAILLTDYSEGLKQQFGDFAEQSTNLLKRAGNTRQVQVYDAIKSQFPTDQELKDIKGIWITGSVSDAYADDAWILNLVEFIKRLTTQHKEIPLVGICFGHQVISRALGAKVAKNPQGWEIGSYQVEISKDQDVQELFDGLDKFQIMEVHQDIVFDVPPSGEYKNLGSTKISPVQGLFKKGEVLTFQGHPEFGRELVEFVIDLKEKDGSFSHEFAQSSIESLSKGHDGVKLAKVILKFIENK